MQLKALISQNQKSLFAIVAFSLIPLFCSSLLITTLIKYEHFLLSATLGQCLIIFSTTTLTMALALTPTTLIALVSGYFLGWLAVPFIIPSYLAASALGYGLGSLLDGGHLLASLKKYPNASKVAHSLHQNDWTLVILARISPVLPFALTNLLLPALNIRFIVFLLAGFIGMLPRTLFALWLGIQTQDIIQLLKNPGHDWIATLFPILLTIFSTAALVFLLQKLIRRSLHNQV